MASQHNEEDSTPTLREGSWRARSALADSGHAPTVRAGFSDAPQSADAPIIPAHKLISLVGLGSYGSIWLAINAMGVYRAVKIVYRDHFAEDRPYEREYEGIKNFEPLSRTHEGFVDILQVERNDQNGYFYYVMELADDLVLGQEIDPAVYKAKTLAAARDAGGRMDLGECLEIGLSLSAALEHLHRNKLVHRDIKAANIVFVNGIPKLADIGLVSSISEESTFVGTPGFIPPEGPGAPAADIYSLGKVLYEISTGCDRYDFPAFPEELGRAEPAYAEWESILLKACADNVLLRYQAATELQAHLALVRAGKSVQTLMRFERTIGLAKRFAPVLLALLLGVPMLAISIARESRRRADEQQRQAGSYVAHGSRDLRDGLYLSALPWFVRALELDPANEPTHRVRIGSVLRQSPMPVHILFITNASGYAEFGPTDDIILAPWAGGSNAVWEISTRRPLSPLFGTGRASFSGDFKKVVISDAGAEVTVWDLETAQPRTLSHQAWVTSAQFSPDHARVVTTENESAVAKVWDVRSATVQFRLQGATQAMGTAEFSPDGKQIVTGGLKGEVIIWDAADGRLLRRLEGHQVWVQAVAFSPDGRWLATASGDHTARIRERDTGRDVTPVLQHDDHVMSAEFSQDGRWLLTASVDGTAHIWDTRTGEHALPVLPHYTRIVKATFSPGGSRVLVQCVDGTAFVWELRPLLQTAPNLPIEVSGDGQRVVRFQQGKFELTEGADGSPPVAIKADWSTPADELALDLKGDSVLFRYPEETSVYSVPQERMQPLAQSQGLRAVALSANGERVAGLQGAEVIVWSATEGDRACSIQPGFNAERIAFDSTGRRLAIAAEGRLELYSIAGKQWRRVLQIIQEMNVPHLEFSPDGELLLACTSDGQFTAGVAQIWRADSGERVGPPMAHRDGILYATFSPSGSRILTCSEDFSAVLWDVRSSTPLPIPPLRHPEQVLHGRFSASERWALTVDKFQTVRVWDTASGELITPPWTSPAPVTSARFLFDDTQLLIRHERSFGTLRSLPRGEYPVTDLHYLTEIVSGQDVKQVLSASGKSRDEIKEAWEYLQRRYPAGLASGIQ